MKIFSDWMTLTENQDLEGHPFKYVEQYKAFIVKVIHAEAQKYQPNVVEAVNRVNAAKASKNQEAINRAVSHANTVGGIARGFMELAYTAQNLHPDTEDLDSIRRSMVQAIAQVSQKYSATHYKDLLKFFERIPGNISSAYDKEYRGMSPAQRRARANAQIQFRRQPSTGQ